MYVKPEETVVEMKMSQSLLTQSNEELSPQGQFDFDE